MSLKENAQSELFDFDIAQRAQTILLSIGLITFGVALGVKWAAVKTVTSVSRFLNPQTALLPMLAELWNGQITLMLVTSGICLVTALAVDIIRGADDE